MKGFFAGVLWGTIVVTLGLAVASEVAPMPDRRAATVGGGRVVVDASAALADGVSIRKADASDEVDTATADAVPPVSTLAPADRGPDLSSPDLSSPPDAPDPAATATVATPLVPPVDDPVMDRPVTDDSAAPAVVDAPTLAPPPAVNAVAPDAPVDPASGPDAAAPTVLADAPSVEPAPRPVAAPSADAGPAPTEPPQPPVTAAAVSAPAPTVVANADPAPSPDTEAVVTPDPVPDASAALTEAAPVAPAPDRPAVPDDALVILPVPKTTPPVQDAEAPAPVAAAASGPAPTPGLDGTVDGVTVGRLPRIGGAATDAGAATAPADATPLARYARAFKNPEGKPAFAIVLIDQGLPAPDRARLAALPFPVTFALDPTMPQAAEAAVAYREAGQEVAMLATGIPPGATAADLEVTFEAHARALPEAVVVLDLESGGFQTDRALATQVVPVIAGQGRGVVTWDGGLNAGAQVAQRDGVAAGTVFRRFDPEGASVPTMRRMLDRAAFKAAQDGRVIVVGNASAELTVALLAWSLEGRAASVALAPVSAVLTKPAR